jgi:hypothetical protein
MHRARILIIGFAATVLASLAAVSASASHRRPGRRAAPVVISVLSGRADLVSGGSALVEIEFPGPSEAKHVRVLLGKRNITGAFAIRSDGHFDGLVSGLALGPNMLRALLPDGSGARLKLIDHPIGGPVFSGPQLEPWKCPPKSLDAKCDQSPTFSYVYLSTSPLKSGFQPYDPSRPPADVASTTTDQGVHVPFVVRIETGYIDRDQYKIATLFQPGQPWSPFHAQRQWNHKLLITHGGSCGVDHESGGAPSVTSFNPLPVSGPAPVVADSVRYALGRGFMVMSTALDNSGHDCNVAVQAESLVMTKEHLIKAYGTLRYTIGAGCSGGSLAIQWISNAYPGIYQGILPTCSFPDAFSSATQVADYALIERYYLIRALLPTQSPLLLPNQLAAIEGNLLPVDALVSVGCTNPNPPYTPSTCQTGYFYGAVPYWPCRGVSSQQLYNAQTNPGGVRCSIVDLNKNLLGLRGPAVWSPQERRIGHGFTGLPIDNVGVQYGLQALDDGQITPAQFVDLNANIGGADIDVNPTPNRIVADEPALANSYRTGLINETNNLNQTAIIDCRGPDPGAAHDSYRAFAIRARLDREHGTHANQLIWEGPAPIIGDAQCNLTSFIAMDRWLSAVERDTSRTPLARKIVSDKPADLSDRCYLGVGSKLTDGLCPAAVVPVYGTPRTVAGDPITTDANKCQLKPLRRPDYPVQFTDSEWAELQNIFSSGVCDYSKPGVGQQPTVPWLTYQDARGRVIYGGRPLGAPPVSTPIVPPRPRGPR